MNLDEHSRELCACDAVKPERTARKVEVEVEQVQVESKLRFAFA